MMEVDDPSAVSPDEEAKPAASAVETSSESQSKSPDLVVRENDDLPALVISDSEGEEDRVETETEAAKSSKSTPKCDVDISGIAPLQATVIDVDAHDASVKTRDGADTSPPTEGAKEKVEEHEEIEAPTPAEQQEKCDIYENIDLTGTSSADDSGISDPGAGQLIAKRKERKKEENVAKVVKDCASMTAQELLQSLLGMREDDDLVQSEVATRDEATSEACSDMIIFNNDESVSQRQRDSKATATEAQSEQELTAATRDACETSGSGPKQDEVGGSEDSGVVANKPNRVVPTPNAKASDDDDDGVKLMTESNVTASATQVAAEKHDMQERSQVDDGATTSPNDGADDDDGEDDDVVCLLEELDEIMALEKDAQDEQLSGGGKASSSVDSANLVVDVSKANDATENKQIEEDFMEEPPCKRARNTSYESDSEGNVRVSKPEEEQNKGLLVVNDKNSIENLRSDIAGGEKRLSESGKTKSGLIKGTSRSPSTSRPPSSVGEPIKSDESESCKRSTTQQEREEFRNVLADRKSPTDESLPNLTAPVGVKASPQPAAPIAPPPPLQCLDVLIIDDDDDEDAPHDDTNDNANDKTVPAANMDCQTTATPSVVESGGKRPRDTPDSIDDNKRSKLDMQTVPSPDVPGPEVKEPKSSPTQPRSPSSGVPSDVKPVAIDFLRKFSKPLRNITRDDLEELVLQKICEAMVFKSELAEERKRADKMETVMNSFRQRLADLSKQHSDLKVVHDRAVLDLRRKADRFVTPVKITRAVGLQVNITPHYAFHSAFRLGTELANRGSAEHRAAELSIVPTTGNNNNNNNNNKNNKNNNSAALTDTVGCSGTGALDSRGQPMAAASAALANIAQRAGYLSDPAQRHPLPPSQNAVRTSTPSMNVASMHNASTSTVPIKPGGSARPYNGLAIIEAQPNTNGGPVRGYKSTATTATNGFEPDNGSATNTLQSEQRADSGGGRAGVLTSPLTARKKTIHKITPKRPPLSAVQQLEQEKMARQQQELMLIEMHSQQARMARAAAGSKSGNGAENSAAGISQVVQGSGQKLPTTRVTTVAPIRPANQMLHGSTVTVRGVNTNNNRGGPDTIVNTATVTNPTLQAGSIPSAKQPQQSTASSGRSSSSSAAAAATIDLTDEEENPRGTPIGAHPANGSRPNQTNGGQPVHQRQLHTSNGVPSGEQLPNRVVRMSNVVRQQPGKYRILNGHTSTVVGASLAASNTTISKYGTGDIPGTSGPMFRPMLSRRPASAATMNGAPLARNQSNAIEYLAIGKGQPQSHMIPGPLPLPGPQSTHPSWKKLAPAPAIRINNVPTGIVISWSMPELSDAHAEIDTYQIYAFQEPAGNAAPEGWRHVGDVNSLPLPMAVTLTHFHEGQRYHFAVRAVDIHKRMGQFSEPRTWSDANVSQQSAS